MTSQEQMAAEAWEEMWGGQASGCMLFTSDQFRTAVAKTIGEAIAAEREACAMLVEEGYGDAGILEIRTVAKDIAEAIRARQ